MSAALEALRRRFDGHQPGLLGARNEYAVLCPLLEQPDGVHLLFEVRAAQLRQGGRYASQAAGWSHRRRLRNVLFVRQRRSSRFPALKSSCWVLRTLSAISGAFCFAPI